MARLLFGLSAIARGQEHFECGRAGLAIHVHKTTVTFHDANDGRKSQTCPSSDFFSSKERIENFVDYPRRNTCAGVAHLENDVGTGRRSGSHGSKVIVQLEILGGD